MEKEYETRSGSNAFSLSKDEKVLTGYVLKWNSLSELIGGKGRLGSFKEKFNKGSLTDSLKKDDQRFLFSHDTSQVLGRKKSGTLVLSEDGIGLKFRLNLPETTLGNDLHELVKRGDISGMSFSFIAIDDYWNDFIDPQDTIRTVKKAKLHEVSAVAFPAYPDSIISVNGESGLRESARDSIIKLLDEDDQDKRKRIVEMIEK